MMKRIGAIAVLAAAMVATSAPAFAAVTVQAPEPLSLSLLAGGIVAIAAVKHFHRK